MARGPGHGGWLAPRMQPRVRAVAALTACASILGLAVFFQFFYVPDYRRAVSCSLVRPAPLAPRRSGSFLRSPAERSSSSGRLRRAVTLVSLIRNPEGCNWELDFIDDLLNGTDDTTQFTLTKLAWPSAISAGDLDVEGLTAKLKALPVEGTVFLFNHNPGCHGLGKAVGATLWPMLWSEYSAVTARE